MKTFQISLLTSAKVNDITVFHVYRYVSEVQAMLLILIQNEGTVYDELQPHIPAPLQRKIHLILITHPSNSFSDDVGDELSATKSPIRFARSE